MMKKFKVSAEIISAIEILLEDALWALDENEIYHEEVILHDIMSQGAEGLLGYVDMGFEELPESVVNALDDLHDEVWNSLDNTDLIEEFIEEFLAEFYI